MALAPESKLTQSSLDDVCINSIPVLAIDAVQKANSGHPGMPMGMAPVANLLFPRYIRHNPTNPRWYGRDRFVLSAGHGSMLPELEKRGHAVRVVSMPSIELFEQQDTAYRDSVLPPNVKRRLAIEAGVPLSWHRWVGSQGDIIGMTTFGASGPSQDVLKHFGFTPENVVERALSYWRAERLNDTP